MASAQEDTPSVEPAATEAPAEESEAGGEEEQEKSIDEKINEGFGKATGWFVKSIFSSYKSCW